MTLKLKAKRFLVQFKIIIKIINIILMIKNGKRYNKKIKYRAKLSIFDIEELSNDLENPYDEYVFDNNMYGIGFWLKKYANIGSKLNTYIEHGLFLGDYIEIDEKEWYVKSITTMSEKRRIHLVNNGINKQINVIGPYINYADYYTNYSEFLKLKKKLGRTLLIFPSHSTKNILESNFSHQIIKYVNLHKHEFDTIMINLYYIDACNKDILAEYRNENYMLTCAGHKFDPYFLSRLKTIISLADMTASNSGSIGTHIGYCLSLNKPHHIFETISEKKPRNEVGVKLLNSVNVIREHEKLEIENVFSKYSEEINKIQYTVACNYWGLNEIKSKGEISDLLL